MAHANPRQLSLLLKLIDDPRNDIYLHIDKGSSSDFKLHFSPSLAYSQLHIIPSISIHWGGWSQIECEIKLLEAAASSATTYSYYHLLSGMDLPIKNQDTIHDFFHKHSGKEFLACWFTEENNTFTNDLYERLRFYYPLQDLTPRLDTISPRISKLLQRMLHINRIRDKTFKLAKGANWFSITSSFAEYVLGHQQFIRKYFRSSLCGDEIFMQTLLVNSPYRESLWQDVHNQNLRCIDWERGKPYTFRADDFMMLTQSKAMFARKFDERLDNTIIEMVQEHVGE